MSAPPRRFAPLLGALALAATAACAREDERPPNLVLVVVDTLRADHVLDPGDRVDTPAIDALAADGVSFTRAFSHAPMTLPSHTALFSSQRPDRSGIVLNGQRVPERLPLLAEHLAARGFATGAAISIWTLGTPSFSYGIERGFQHYERDFFGLLPPAPWTDERLREVLGELEASERPFFLFAHYSDPHLPYNVRDGSVERTAEYLWNGEVVAELSISTMSIWEHEFVFPPGRHVLQVRAEHPFQTEFELEYDESALVPLQQVDERGRSARSFTSRETTWENRGEEPTRLGIRLWLAEEPDREEKRARYPGEVEFVDEYVGALMDELKTRGLYEDALVVFTSDHGEAFGEHGWWGHKENLYDELLHVPLIVKPPAGHASLATLGAVRDELTAHVDVVPTLLEILDVPPLPDQQGRSLLEPDAPREVFAATRKERDEEDIVALRDERYKLMYFRREDRFLMYDLDADPAERRDVFAERGAERASWADRLRAAAARVEATGGLADMTPEERAKLEKLGYFGDDDE